MYVQQHLSIKAWAEDDRPREKLLLKGRHTLSDAELLAILIGTGTRFETAVDLCKRILAEYNFNLDDLAGATVSDLRKFHGVGEAKAITIVAAMELGRRRAATPSSDLASIRSSGDAYRAISPTLSDLLHEEFWILLVNRANQITKKCFISKGGMNATLVDPKIVFKTALDNGSGGIVLCHNHPSGTCKPSEQDLKLTKKLMEGANILEISLLDHIIVGAKTYFSFADQGLL
jgi:DNA repair protein RadC